MLRVERHLVDGVSGDDHDHVGHRGEHGRLGGDRQQAGAVRGRNGRSPAGRGEGQAGDSLACGQATGPVGRGLSRLRGLIEVGRRRPEGRLGHHRPEEGDGRRPASQLLAEQAHLDHAQAEPPIVLGLLDGQPSLVHHDLPQMAFEVPVGRHRLGQAHEGSHPLGRGVIVEHAVGRIPQVHLI